MKLSALVSYIFLALTFCTHLSAQYLENFENYSWQEKDSIITTLFQGGAYNVVGLMIEDAYQQEKENDDIAAKATFAMWQGVRYIVDQKPEEATGYLEEALELFGGNPSFQTDRYRDALLNLAEIKLQVTEYDEALSLLEGAISYMESDSNSSQELYLSTLFQGLDVALSIEALDQAETLGRKGLSFAQAAYGNQSDEYCQSLSNIGRIYLAKGDIRRASNMILQAYELSKQYLSPNNVRRAYYGLAAADIQDRLGRSIGVKKIYDELLGFYDQHISLQDDASYTRLLSLLGAYYEQTGDLDRAYEYLNRANILLTLRLETTDPIYIQSQADVGNILNRQEKYSEAEGYYVDAIRQAAAAYGADSWSEGLLRDRLASMYFTMGKYADALDQREKTVDIIEKSLGPNDPEYAIAVLNLGLTHAALDQDDLAQQHLLNAHGKLTQLYGTNHFRVFTANRQLASYYQERDLAKAAKYYKDCGSYILFHHQNIMPLLTDSEQIQIRNLFDTFQGEYLDYILTSTSDPSGVVDFYKLLSKTRSLSNIPSVRTFGALTQNMDSDVRKAYLEWQQIRNQILDGAELTIIGQKEIGFSLPQTLEKQVTLAAKILPGYGSVLDGSDIISVLSSLKANEAYIDFMALKRFDHSERTLDQNSTYFAFITKGQKTNIVELHLNQNVLETHQTRSGTQFYDQIWKPLEAYVSEGDRIYVTMSEALHKITLSAIPLPSGDLIFDHYDIITLSDPFTLPNLREIKIGQRALLVGHPEMNQLLDSPGKHTSLMNISPNMLARFEERLTSPIQSRSASEQEVKLLGGVLKKKKKNARVLFGTDARRDVFKSSVVEDRPSLIHLSVPLYFGSKPELTDSLSYPALSYNPSLRVGLALAGAGAAWKMDTIKEANIDVGLMSALEVESIDLTATDLLIWTGTASTKRGDIGHDFYTIQNSLFSAGAKKLIFSLWDVPEQQKMVFLQLLYKNLLKGMSAEAALRKTQVKLRKKADPQYWAGFVLIQ